MNERILMSSPEVGGDKDSNLKITQEVLKTPVNSYSKKFRDLVNKKSEWTKVVAERILMPTFIGENDLMWPHDPMGRHGPNLDQFLRF